MLHFEGEVCAQCECPTFQDSPHPESEIIYRPISSLPLLLLDFCHFWDVVIGLVGMLGITGNFENMWQALK